MKEIINVITWTVLAAHLLMALAAVWYVWRGKNSIIRLSALDLTSTLTLGVLVLVSILEENSIYMDTAIALAALSYLSTVVLAKFISDQKVF